MPQNPLCPLSTKPTHSYFPHPWLTETIETLHSDLRAVEGKSPRDPADLKTINLSFPPHQASLVPKLHSTAPTLTHRSPLRLSTGASTPWARLFALMSSSITAMLMLHSYASQLVYQTYPHGGRITNYSYIFQIQNLWLSQPNPLSIKISIYNCLFTRGCRIVSVFQSCHINLYIKKIRPFLTQYATQHLVQSVVISHTDKGNSLTVGLPACMVIPAWLVFNQPQRLHVIPLIDLQWLPMAAQIKLLSLA